MKLTPDSIQDLVTIAFCLEPLSDKPGCTTRFVDLPNRPLTDFIVSGINAGKFFRFFAQDIIDGKDPDIFFYHPTALLSSNQFKSSKIVNFGLLEIMFPAVYARMHCDIRDGVVDALLDSVKKHRPTEVRHLCDARKIAWKTSEKSEKTTFTGDEFLHTTSVHEFYEALYSHYPSDSSNHQWAEQYRLGLPIVREALECLEKMPVLRALEVSYTSIHKAHPEWKVGIVADMCAAALFIHLSF